MEGFYNQKKCEHCQNWTNGDKAFCSNCGEILDYKYRKKMDDLDKYWQKQSVFMNLFKIKNSENNLLLKFIESIIRGGQLIVMSIITLTTIILLALPG